MAYVKKLTDEEFLEMVIDKELEIGGAPFRYKDIMAKPIEERKTWRWFQEYMFDTLEQFLEWRQFFYDHFYDWQPKSVSKARMKREFQWWNLQWGLKYNFDYQTIYEYDESRKNVSKKKV